MEHSKQAIRLLQIEDSEADAELVVRLLNRSGYEIHAQRVECEEQLKAALEQESWNLIIADYRLPFYSAPAALELYRHSGLDIPFLVVSGTIGEEAAVAMMRAGAHDYLLKDQLERLPPAVERELHEAELRKEKRVAESALRLAYSELESIYDHAPVLLFIVDRELCIEKLNGLAARFCSCEAGGCRGKTICETLCCAQMEERLRMGQPVVPCKTCVLSRAILGALTGDSSIDPVEITTPLPHSDCGNPSILLASVAPVAIHASDRRRSVLICAQDVTSRKQAEQALRDSVESLRAALRQNEVLFQEVHHRVKNNLQIVASLLSMKARKPRELLGAEDLKDCERRIRSMSTIHEQLYSQKDMSELDFSQYAGRIVPELIASYEDSKLIALRLELEPVALSLDQSIPCGLILNELVTNAVKYAYPEHKGEIAVCMGRREGWVEMAVADQGVGIAAGAQAAAASLGTQIVQMLTKQLKGRLEYSSPPGLTVTLRFPAASVSEAARKPL